MAFAPWIGRTRTQHDEVTDGLIARLCATIDTARPPASHAPQGAHWCLCLPDAPTAALGVDGHPVAENGADAFMPPIPLPRRMWAGSAVQFHAPIAGGAAIERQSTIHAVADKTGTTGPLIFVTVDHAIWADGILAVQERQNIVYRDAATTPATFATPRAGHATLNHADWPDQRRIAPHEAQLARYSAITFNAHRIHYDRPYAVEQEGYAGLVVHGPLTATLLLDHAARLVGDNRLTHFDFRGLAPAYCGEMLTLAARRDGPSIALSAFGPTGVEVMRATATV